MAVVGCNERMENAERFKFKFAGKLFYLFQLKSCKSFVNIDYFPTNSDKAGVADCGGSGADY